MNYLIKGEELKEKIEILISLTGLDSEPMEAAMVDHFCRNMSKSHAAALNGVQQSNLSRDIKKIDIVAGKLERLKELDWPDYKKAKEYYELSKNTDL